jgi:hypothetical protein
VTISEYRGCWGGGGSTDGGAAARWCGEAVVTLLQPRAVGGSEGWFTRDRG